MNDLLKNDACTFVRRFLFVAFLLFIGPATTIVSHYVQNSGSTSQWPIWVLVWGMESSGSVLAVWLVARSNIWSSVRGWLRAAIYIVAYGYGGMLRSTTQDWRYPSKDTFRLPGSEFNDYVWPALELLHLLIFSWLLIPVAIATKTLLLSSRDNGFEHARRYSISGLVGFTTMAAIALAWIRFLASESAPRSYYSYLTQSDAIKEWIVNLAFMIPPLIAIMVMLFGFRKQWWMPLLTLLCAIALDGFGSRFVVLVKEQVTGLHDDRRFLAGPALDCWMFVCGRSLTAWSAFGTAKLLGVWPAFGGAVAPSKE